MYRGTIAGGLLGAGGAGSVLPQTGMNLGWQIVAGITLIVAGLTLARLVPRLRRRNG